MPPLPRLLRSTRSLTRSLTLAALALSVACCKGAPGDERARGAASAGPEPAPTLARSAPSTSATPSEVPTSAPTGAPEAPRPREPELVLKELGRLRFQATPEATGAGVVLDGSRCKEEGKAAPGTLYLLDSWGLRDSPWLCPPNDSPPFSELSFGGARENDLRVTIARQFGMRGWPTHGAVQLRWSKAGGPNGTWTPLDEPTPDGLRRRYPQPAWRALATAPFEAKALAMGAKAPLAIAHEARLALYDGTTWTERALPEAAQRLVRLANGDTLVTTAGALYVLSAEGGLAPARLTSGRNQGLRVIAADRPYAFATEGEVTVAYAAVDRDATRVIRTPRTLWVGAMGPPPSAPPLPPATKGPAQAACKTPFVLVQENDEPSDAPLVRALFKGHRELAGKAELVELYVEGRYLLGVQTKTADDAAAVEAVLATLKPTQRCVDAVAASSLEPAEQRRPGRILVFQWATGGGINVGDESWTNEREP